MAINAKYNFKIILLGESGVGKTSMTHTYTSTTVNSNHSKVNLTSKELVVKGKQVQLHIWETSSQAFFKHVAPNYYDGVLLVYDITDRKTFDPLSDWLILIRQNCDGAVTLVVGNKMNDSKSAAVSRDEALRFTRDEDLELMEFCAKDKDSVMKIFEHLTLKIIQAKSLVPTEEITDESSTPSMQSIQSDECELITEQPESMNTSNDETLQQQTNLRTNGNLNTSRSADGDDDELELSFVWVSFLPPIVKLPPDITPLQVGRRRTSADSVLSMMTESDQITFRLGAEERRNAETLERKRH